MGRKGSKGMPCTHVPRIDVHATEVFKPTEKNNATMTVADCLVYRVVAHVHHFW